MGGESSPKDRDAPPLLCRRRHHLQSQPEAVSHRKGRSPSLTRHRFEAYLDKVFGFSDLVSALPEGRQFAQHAWKKGKTAMSQQSTNFSATNFELGSISPLFIHQLTR